MEQKSMNHWDIMQACDPEMSSAVAAWRKRITDNEAIPPKYQELIKMAIACAIRFPQAITAHAQGAIKNGASRDELFHTLELAMMLGGIPAYREGAMLLKDVLMEHQE